MAEPRIPGLNPRTVDPDILDSATILRELQLRKFSKIRERVRSKLDVLNKLGVKKCVSCEQHIGLDMKGFIAMVICMRCFDAPSTKLAMLLRSVWIKKETKGD